MRIAIANWSNRKAGGAEIYLSRIFPALSQKGHALAFLYEVDLPLARNLIGLPEGVPSWCIVRFDAERALQELAQWHPDLIYAHGFSDPKLEAEILKIAPVVFFAHNYYGTCISGGKTFKSPVVKPCSRRFGWPCLLHYYPHRCGGLNPVTMWKDYVRQSKRLALLRKYRAVLVASDHMRNEYLKHGIPAERVHHVPLPIEDEGERNPMAVRGISTQQIASSGWRLLFLGRMDFLKGGEIPQQCTVSRCLSSSGIAQGSEVFGRLYGHRDPNIGEPSGGCADKRGGGCDTACYRCGRGVEPVLLRVVWNLHPDCSGTGADDRRQATRPNAQASDLHGARCSLSTPRWVDLRRGDC